MSITIRRLKVGEEAEGMRSIDTLWRKDHILARDKALFSWQFRSRKDDEYLHFYVATDGERPIACNGTIEMDGHYHGDTFIAHSGSCFIILPEYRKGNFFFEFYHACHQEAAMCFGMGASKTNMAIHRGRRDFWYVTDEVPRYVALVDREAMASLLQHYGSESPDFDNYSPCGRAHCIPNLPHTYRTTALRKAELPEWDHAWWKLFAPNLQGIVKDAAYLRWRYLMHPTFEYQLLAVRDSCGAICGLAVLRVVDFIENIKAVRIVEFLAADSTAGSILANAVVESTPPGTAFLEHTAFGNQWRPLANIGMSARGNNLFSVYFDPPDFSYTRLNGLFSIEYPGVLSTEFMGSSDIYLTVADADQDEPNRLVSSQKGTL